MISSASLRCAYVAFGANLGDVEQTYAKVKQRLESLSEGRQVRASRLRRTHPVGGPNDQPMYFNGCFEILGGPPHDVLFDRLMELERQFGRTRSTLWAARTIDLDLLLANEFVGRPDIDLPHPRLHHRRFVLEPLVDLAPQIVHPWLMRTASELLELVRRPDPTFLAFSPSADLTNAARSVILSRLPAARVLDYPLNSSRPIFFPPDKTHIATVAPPTNLEAENLDFTKFWALLLGDAEYPVEKFAAAQPLPTLDARADTVDNVLANVGVFLDSFGIDWIEG